MPKKGYRQSEEHKRKRRFGLRGVEHPNWRGGLKNRPLTEHSKEYKREWNKVWRKNNPELARFKDNQKKLKRQKLIIGEFTYGEWENLKKQYGLRCPACLKYEPEIKLTIDHIIPITKGGMNVVENIQPLCHRCNSQKRTKIIKY